jgi:hypothetical protein
LGIDDKGDDHVFLDKACMFMTLGRDSYAKGSTTPLELDLWVGTHAEAMATPKDTRQADLIELSPVVDDAPKPVAPRPPRPSVDIGPDFQMVLPSEPKPREKVEEVPESIFDTIVLPHEEGLDLGPNVVEDVRTRMPAREDTHEENAPAATAASLAAANSVNLLAPSASNCDVMPASSAQDIGDA